MAARQKHLDIFLTFPVPLIALQPFQTLQSLSIVGQASLTSLQGLNACPSLISLRIDQCAITRLDGIQQNTQLKELFACNNRISHMAGLSSLIQLERLWLCGNRIREISSLHTLTNLKELSLADNAIEAVSQSLAHNSKIEELVLACNHISSFDDVLRLRHMQSLKRLALADEHFGKNPVCDLSNYKVSSFNGHVHVHVSGCATCVTRSNGELEKRWLDLGMNTSPCMMPA